MEAALIIPFVTLVMIAVIALGFRLFDEILVETAADRTFSECERMVEAGGTLPEEELVRLLRKNLNGTFGYHIVQASVTGGEASYRISVLLRAGGDDADDAERRRFFGVLRDIRYERTIEIFDRETAFRRVHAAERLIMKGI